MTSNVVQEASALLQLDNVRLDVTAMLDVLLASAPITNASNVSSTASAQALMLHSVTIINVLDVLMMNNVELEAIAQLESARLDVITMLPAHQAPVCSQATNVSNVSLMVNAVAQPQSATETISASNVMSMVTAQIAKSALDPMYVFNVWAMLSVQVARLVSIIFVTHQLDVEPVLPQPQSATWKPKPVLPVWLILNAKLAMFAPTANVSQFVEPVEEPLPSVTLSVPIASNV